ncbi:MAG: FumA C-terminus/TtdB family hydratase beta subunit [Candidatus Bipolaricaulota bacterium]
MEKVLTTPIAEADVREFHVGDVFYVTGRMFTARDGAHKMMMEKGAPLSVEGLPVFHCGPVVRKVGEGWDVLAGGPTTSVRMEGIEPDFLRRFRPRVIVGKGGMGEKTLAALSEVGAVYTHFTGGAGALAAQAVKEVEGVYWLEELGIPEAVWVLRVDNFGPLVVTMDSHGRSLHAELATKVGENMKRAKAAILSE